MKDWNIRLNDSYINRTMRNKEVTGERMMVNNEMRSEPTNMLIERRLVKVKELKKEENNSIRNKTRRNE